MNEILERIIQFFFDLYSSLFGNSKYGSAYSGVEGLIGLIRVEVFDKRMVWPDIKTELPWCVYIELSVPDCMVYNERRDLLAECGRKELVRYAADKGYEFEREPVINLIPNDQLKRGRAIVHASIVPELIDDNQMRFDSLKTVSMNQAGFGVHVGSVAQRNPVPHSSNGDSKGKSLYSSGDPAILKTEVMNSQVSKAPEMSTNQDHPCAHISNDDCELEIKPNSVIGHLQSQNQEPPNVAAHGGDYIALEGDQYRYVSRRHGHFEYENDRWYFVDDDSTNGTHVKHGDEWIDLVPGVSHALQDGDLIGFGQKRQGMLFSAS